MDKSKGFSPHVENAVIAIDTARSWISLVLGMTSPEGSFFAPLKTALLEIDEAMKHLEKTPADSYRSRYEEEEQLIKDFYFSTERYNSGHDRIQAIRYLRELRKRHERPDGGLKECKDAVESWLDPNALKKNDDIPF